MEIKIPFYNILNMFLTGLVFIGGCTMVYPEVASNILLSDVMVSLGTGPEIVFTVCVFAAAYEVGLIINRIGSVIIEPIFKKVKLIPFNDDYKEFNKKKKEFPIMSTLSREYALSRTGVALFGILSAVAYHGDSKFLGRVFVMTAVIYYLSYRKHARKIVTLMEKDATAEEKGSDKE